LAANHKILVLTPAVTARGGVSNYFQALKNKFTWQVDYQLRGARDWPYRKSRLQEALRTVKDVWGFGYRLATSDYSIIQTNTTFDRKGVARDALFLLVSRAFNIRKVVFFRGWVDSMEADIDNGYLRYFRWFYFWVDAMLVLSRHQEIRLREWGYKGRIFIETTLVDEALIEGWSEDKLQQKFAGDHQQINLLYLARVEVAKGIYETLDTYQLLVNKYPNLHLSIAGDGTEDEAVQRKIEQESIPRVTILGHVSDDAKIKAYQQADIYIFLSYAEGMPNSVLEAMAFGLPVVTRAVGGLVDFFENGKHGFITETKDPVIIADIVQQLLDDKSKRAQIGINNYRYASERFTTSQVVARLETIYASLLQ